MTVRKILAILALVVATSLAYSKYVPLWGERVFSDDPSWPSPYETNEFDDSAENEDRQKFFGGFRWEFCYKEASSQDSDDTTPEFSPLTLSSTGSSASRNKAVLPISSIWRPRRYFTLALVAATCPAYSMHVLWGEGVFPDDPSWSSSYETFKLFDFAENEVDTKNYNLCKTEECKKVADEFLSSMNKSVDPCDDFYEFTCGAWSAKDTIPPSKAAWSRFMIFQDMVQRRIKGVLETKPDPSDILPVRQAKKWYHSCMDTENLERRGVRPIESILLQTGGWPITMDEDEWDAEGYPWQIVERHYARLTGAYTFYKVEQSYSMSDNSPTVRISAADIPLSHQLPLKYRNYTGNEYDIYVRLVEVAAKLFVQHNRADVPEERMVKEAREIVEFEKEIYELNQQPNKSFIEFNTFVEWYDTNMTELNSDPKAKIDWRSMMQGLLDMMKMRENKKKGFYTIDKEYFVKMSKLLKRTPARTIVNYIHWNFVATMLPYTTEDARDALFELVNKEYGVKERAPRWSECVYEMKMTQAAAYVFVDKYFTKSTETAALEMIKNIQIAMAEQIEKSNWLNVESKNWAKEKLINMRKIIGFPDWYKNKTVVINHYKGLIIGADYFDNTLSYIRYMAKKEFNRMLGSKEELDTWSDNDPITVNALYYMSDNAIRIPAADFQTPLFTPQFPNNVNYATAGVVAGHEMGHGFDDYSIKYGNGWNATTLPKAVLKNYYQRAKCFLDQYERYFEGYDGTNPPESGGTTAYPLERKRGLHTRAENIADSTGLQSVFEAYKKVSKKSSYGETRLPGLEEFTDDQLFFLSFAAMWCKVDRPEYEKKIKEDKSAHSPSKFRVIGAVSNTKGFAKAFNCPKESPMNPGNKCNIWEKPGATMKMEPGGGSRNRNHHRWAGQWNS